MRVYLVLSAFLFFAMLIDAFRYHVGTSNRRVTSLEAVKDIQVRLLVDIKGQGRKGEVVKVSPALWSNVLQPKKQAEKVSDEEIAREAKLAAEKESAILAKALEYASVIEKKVGDSNVKIFRKIGNNGQLFGTVTAKQVMESLRQTAPSPVLDDKGTSVTKIVNADDGNVVDEVRRAGVYKAEIKLHPKVSSSFEFVVSPEV